MVDSPTRPRVAAPRETGALDEPGRRELVPTLPRLVRRRQLIEPEDPEHPRRGDHAPPDVASSTTGLTKNEPTLRRFGSSSSMTMDLIAAQIEDRGAEFAEARRAAAGEALRDLRVAEIRRSAGLEAEPDLEDDVRVVGSAKHAAAIAETALRGGQDALFERLTVEHPNALR